MRPEIALNGLPVDELIKFVPESALALLGLCGSEVTPVAVLSFRALDGWPSSIIDSCTPIDSGDIIKGAGLGLWTTEESPPYVDYFFFIDGDWLSILDRV